MERAGGGAATVSAIVCESCGAANRAGASFCQTCSAFVGWDHTAVLPVADPAPRPVPVDPSSTSRPEDVIETRVLPKITEQPSATADPTPVLAVRADRSAVTVPVTGTRVELALTVINRSTIVDGYEVDVGGAPDWLAVDSRPLRLLPGTEGSLVLGFRISSDHTLVPAGRGAVRLRVRSLTQSPAHEIVTVTVDVPVVDAPVGLRTEPSGVRVVDGQAGRFVVVVDNSSANRACQLQLSGSDPELAVGVRFDSDVVSVPAGGSVRVSAVATAPLPAPGTELTRTLIVSATEGRRRVDTTVTLVQSASASAMTTLGLQLDPSVLRLGTRRRGEASVVVDNRRGAHPVRLWLRGDDPENALRFAITPPELSVEAGQVATARLAVTAPRGAVGRETSRPLTVTATDGRATVTASGTLLQTAGDRRPWVRVLLTLAGALAMIMGAMLPLRAVSDGTSFQVGVNAVAGLFNASLDLGGFEQLVSFGTVILVLAGLLVFGLTGRSGRLSRLVALLTVALTVALLITIALVGGSGAPGVGAMVIMIGAGLGYVGGLLTRR